MIDSKARQQLLEYLRFQQEMGVEGLRVDLDRLGWKPVASQSERAAAGATRPAGGPAPTNPLAPAAPGPAQGPAQEPVIVTRDSRDPRPPARTLGELSGAGIPEPPASLPLAPAPAGPGGWPEDAAPADAATRLRIIQDEIGPDCTRCKLGTLGRRHVVFGVGNPRAELVFVGEGPGADEDEQGIPFVGKAGRLLTDMIQKGMGLRRDDVYICNVVKCRPPGNRTPEADECAICGPYMHRQLRAIQPRIVCALGAVAAQNLRPYKGSLVSVRGRIHEIELEGFSTRLVVTYHPAYLLRDPRQKKEAWKDLQLIMQFLGLPMNAKG